MTPFDGQRRGGRHGEQPFVFSRTGVRGGRSDGNGSKKADAVEHRRVLHRGGVLVNEPPGMAGLPFS
jgi:hypothetical protein